MILTFLLMCALFLSLTWNAWQALERHELRQQRDDAVGHLHELAELRRRG